MRYVAGILSYTVVQVLAAPTWTDPPPSALACLSTQALKAAFDEMYQGMVDVDIVDIWTQHAPWPLNTFVGAYQFMAKHPLIWKALWEYGRFPPTRRLSKVSHKRERTQKPGV